MATLDRTRAGYLKLAASGIILGSVGLFVRALTVPVSVILFYRVIFASATILVISLLGGRMRRLRLRDHRGLVVLLGLALTLNWVLFFSAFKMTTIAITILLTYTMPVFAAVLAHFLLGERLEKAAVAALGVALAGIALIVAPSLTSIQGRHLTGAAAALGGAVVFALTAVASKHMMKTLEPLTLMLWANIVAGILIAPFIVRAPGPPDLRSWLMLATLGIVHSGLGIYLYLSGLADVKVQHASVLMYLEPLSAVIYAALWLGELPTWFTLAGGLLILGAGYVVVVRTPVEAPLPPA